MKLATKYAPCLRGQGDDVGIIIFEKINFFGRMTRQGIEPVTSRTRVRNDTSKPSPLGDEMQFGFCPGKGTTDAIFIVRQVQEKYLGKQKELWIAFVDL